MSTAGTRLRGLFSLPGSTATDCGAFLDEAASAHEQLFRRAYEQADSALARSLSHVAEFLGSRALPVMKRRLLRHPLFLEGLHGLAPSCPSLHHWHDSVAPAPPCLPEAADDDAARVSLGHVALACCLRANPGAGGEHRLCTDVLGRVAFPFGDWSLMLSTDRRDLLGRQVVVLRLDRDRAWWQFANAPETPFLVLSRADCLHLIGADAGAHEFGCIEFPDGHVKPRLQCACRLGHGRMRYDPVGFQNFEAHAGLTGALVRELIGAIRLNSPGLYRELRACIHAVRGFEFPESPLGVVGSFSDPTLPGIIGINVPYTAAHEPRLEPFCFTWLGHELAHTKNYLADNILYAQGQTLLRNPADRTTVPRYNRSLAVRTLMQLPFVHLYEWTLLMDFWQSHFAGLPWRVDADVTTVGEDLAAEIKEAFALIEAHAALTPLGEAALRHFRALYARLLARWHSFRPRGRTSA
jgi:hypothetical protein